MPPRFLPLALATGLLLAAGCEPGPAPAPPAGEDPPVTTVVPVDAPAEPTAVPSGEDGKAETPAPPPVRDTAGPAMLERILQIVVTDRGLVRYASLADAELRGALDRVVTWYDRSPVPSDRDEKLAFLCNAYNANVLARAYRESIKPGFESVDEVPGFFDSRPIRVGRDSMTLNQLENEKIRPLGDARIHAALVCAAMSCPPLRAEPYRAADLDAQFDDQCRRWVNDPSKFRIVDGKVGLSKILDWYGEDFDKPPYGNRVGFVLAYADPAGDVARFIANRNAPPTQWIPYDWALNDAK